MGVLFFITIIFLEGFYGKRNNLYDAISKS